MGKSQSVSSPQFDEPLPTATPVDAPAGPPRMAPARAVSPEIESLLPPVGILPGAPPPIPQPEPGPRLALAGKEVDGLPATGSSFVMTLAVIATAMGVGALAMVPALDRNREGRERPKAVPADAPLQVVAANAAAPEQRPTGPLNAEPSTSPTRATAAVSVKPAAGHAGEAALDAQLAEVQSVLRKRDMAGAAERMRQVAASPRTEPQELRIAATAALVSAVHVFWESFGDALDKVPAGRSLQWGGQEAVVVEVSQSHLILRRAGQNLQIARSDLSDEQVKAIAESVLDGGDSRNQVSLGAFHCITEGPMSREARRLWKLAAEAGEDVSLLMSHLAAP